MDLFPHLYALLVQEPAELGVDALILADIGVMDYASERWPELRLHLSVQGSATSEESINFYHKNLLYMFC